MSGIENGLLELAREAWSHDDWAFDLVVAASFRHAMANVECVGFTITSAGRAVCGNCGWAVSGRLDDAGEERSARFALCALARIGEAVAVAQEVAVAFMQEQHGEHVRDVRLDGDGGIIATLTQVIHQAAFTHRVLL
jgi:hypothetical protein